jgi:hypothetical protein
MTAAMIGCTVIHSCRIVRQPGAWVAPPQQPAREKADGTGSAWFPVVEVTSRSVLNQLRRAVLEAWGERGGVSGLLKATFGELAPYLADYRNRGCARFSRPRPTDGKLTP